ncbi:MarC family protein [Endozoicomonas acroporae]|uniref:MarC family protein n=1 Tax=Endozoicomonas acroporae TaxID=1701104 RepID=UPI001FD40A17|nr:MarC family protein [Endozoicomonas acroporae]
MMGKDFYTHAVSVFLGFFAIMNPIANTAAFNGLVGNSDSSERFKIAAKSLIITFSIVLLFSVLGKGIFHVFGITLPALRISGGILVFLVGYHMLNGSASSLQSSHKSNLENIAVSPLAVPLLAGPGTIATAMNYSASGELIRVLMTISIFALLCLITFFCFIFSSRIMALIGKGGLDIVTRLMGLILTVIGVQMLIAGVLEIVSHLA